MSENDNEIEGEEKTLQEAEMKKETGVIEELTNKLELEKEKVSLQEKKIQYLLADFENLKKRSELDVQNKVNSISDNMILKFLSIYDDFIRARDALSRQNANTDGLDAILKNMDSFLSEYGVQPIEALGEAFDPRLHEAISIKNDPELDDDTITTELRKGYVLKDRIIRPSLVEISKKHIKEMN
ncbi:MAG: nucleotide exchange factor GrpE [Thaumarchaeota archaeon]|nr:nucleotide exchange factor GrpE [Nitrososphaerota archaeon]MDE1866493.1 nucleotide exchange factor GrpE [Nitrososphaerota archaeon]